MECPRNPLALLLAERLNSRQALALVTAMLFVPLLASLMAMVSQRALLQVMKQLPYSGLALGPSLAMQLVLVPSQMPWALGLALVMLFEFVLQLAALTLSLARVRALAMLFAPVLTLRLFLLRPQLWPSRPLLLYQTSCALMVLAVAHLDPSHRVLLPPACPSVVVSLPAAQEVKPAWPQELLLPKGSLMLFLATAKTSLLLCP